MFQIISNHENVSNRALAFSIINGVLGGWHSGSLQNMHWFPWLYRRQMVKDLFHGWEGSPNTKWANSKSSFFFQNTWIRHNIFLQVSITLLFSFFYNQGSMKENYHKFSFCSSTQAHTEDQIPPTSSVKRTDLKGVSLSLRFFVLGRYLKNS